MSSNVEEMKMMRHGSSTNHDEKIWNQIEDIFLNSKYNIADVLESFSVYARRVNITRFLAHYELYRMIKDLPGNIVEAGVYRGVSLLSWAKFIEIFHAGDRTRRVYGFDNFAGFQSIHEKDGAPSEHWQKHPGGWNAGPFKNELDMHIDIFHADSFLPRAKRIVLVDGDIAESAPKFVEENPGLRISLLHLDVDLYEPTLAALKAFYPLVIPGGLVVFDEYGLMEWPGETKAVEEYFGNKMPKIQKFSFSSLPGGFFIKE